MHGDTIKTQYNCYRAGLRTHFFLIRHVVLNFLRNNQQDFSSLPVRARDAKLQCIRKTSGLNFHFTLVFFFAQDF
jgi:hypothetical protein